MVFVTPGLVPAVYVLLVVANKTWMAGSADKCT